MVKCSQALFSVDGSLRRYAASAHDSLDKKIANKWLVRGKSSFLLTEPHHADIVSGLCKERGEGDVDGCTKFGLQELVGLSDLTSMNRLERVQQRVIINVGQWCVESEKQVLTEPHHADQCEQPSHAGVV